MTLASDKAFSREENPFQTVATLMAYIEERISSSGE